jgi:hypothetical protein
MSMTAVAAAAKGRARMLEIAREDADARQAEEWKLITGLGRAPSYAERLLIEQAASLVVRGRRLRALGRAREADSLGRQLVRVLDKLTITVVVPNIASAPRS